MSGAGSEGAAAPTHRQGGGADDGKPQSHSPAAASELSAWGGVGDNDGGGAAEGIGKRSTLSSEIQQLKERRDALMAERGALRKELRNTQKRRQRLMKATRRLSADDIRSVLYERAASAVEDGAEGGSGETGKSAAAAAKKAKRTL